MSTFTFIVLYRQGRGADQLLQSFFPNLKEETIYTYTVQWVPSLSLCYSGRGVVLSNYCNLNFRIWRNRWSIPILYNEYRHIYCVLAAGAWCWPITAIFISQFEGRDDLYLYCTMRDASIMELMRPGLGADQILQSSVPNLKEEIIYTYTLQWVPSLSFYYRGRGVVLTNYCNL
jgi:hypothetical protein